MPAKPAYYPDKLADELSHGHAPEREHGLQAQLGQLIFAVLPLVFQKISPKMEAVAPALFSYCMVLAISCS